jgi:predicted PurR-regulated permease PerM
VTDNNPEPAANEPEDFYDKVHRKTWVRRVAGFMGGATLFAAIGAVGGVVAAFMPYAFGALGIAGAAAVGLPTVAAVLSSVALFAAATGLLGMAIGADVGSNAGSVAAGLNEKEKREIANGNSPLKEQGKEKDQKPTPAFNWKVGAVSAGLFAAFGALMAFNPITAAVVVGAVGFPAASTAAVTASATLMGMFGATIGMPFGKYSNQLSNYYSDLITGKMFEENALQNNIASPQASIAQMPERLADEPSINNQQREPKPFAANMQKFSVQNIIEKNAENTADKNVLIQR